VNSFEKGYFHAHRKKTLLAVAMATLISGSAFADDQGTGKIKFKGVVIDAPCSIAPDSVDKESISARLQPPLSMPIKILASRGRYQSGKLPAGRSGR
jgi:hypothetical protein